MSGHSKWSQIKRQKGVNDQKRSQVFSKMSRLITLAVKEGGGITDPDNNIKLRLVMERAKYENMPKDNIDRAIEKATGAGEENMREVVYEGFGPGGVTMLIVAATDNANRTHSDVKNVMEKGGGKMGGVNSVLYQFVKCGVVVFDKATMSESELLDFTDAIEALDMDEDGEHYVVYIPFEKVGQVNRVAGNKEPVTVDIFYKPQTTIALPAADQTRVEKLVELLEEMGDVDKVYSNYG